MPNDSIDPSNYDDYSEFNRLSANRNLLAAMDSDPEKASRSLELAGASGIPAPVINTDPDWFEAQHRAALSSEIVRRNEFLQDYINSDPMAARVSHDDLPFLDQHSDSLLGLGRDSALGAWLKSDSITRSMGQAIRGMATPPESFMEGFGEQPFGQTLFQRPTDVEYALSHPLMASVAGAVSMPLEAVSRVTGGLLKLGHDQVAGMFGESVANELAAMAEWGMMRGDIGVHGGGGGAEGAKAIDLGAIGSVAEGKVRESGLGPEPPAKAKEAGITITPKTVETIRSLASALDIADQYIRAGQEPPAGLHPLLDQAKEAQARQDSDALFEAFKTAAKTATRERSPDLFERFVRMHIGDQEIGIAPEAIRKLYGDKTPAADDGILGWVPDLDRRLASAEGSGSDVRIDLAKFIARADPEIAKELKDDIRFRPEGLTINEGKIGADIPKAEPGMEGPKADAAVHPIPEPKEVIPEPLTSTRGSGGLEPMFSVGDRKITLRRRGEPDIEGLSPEDQQTARELSGRAETHDFDLVDDKGNTIGGVFLSKHGKQLYVENIQAGAEHNAFYQPNFLGPSLIRDIGRQLKAEFPDVFGPDGKGITGYRATGARWHAEKGKFKMPSPEVSKPVVKFELTEDPQAFRDLLQPYWEKAGNRGTEFLIKPEETWTPQEKAAGQAVREELNRIAPGSDVSVVHAISRGSGSQITGMYMQHGRSGELFSLPEIAVSLEEKQLTMPFIDRAARRTGGQQITQVLGTARHEAIHQLRRMGLFTQGEWNTLVDAARSENWMERFNIEKRYPHLDMPDKLEEAIADGYSRWKRGEEITKDTGVFQKIKDFFDSLLRRFKEIYGEDFGWEDLFHRVDEGEVGRREPSKLDQRFQQEGAYFQPGQMPLSPVREAFEQGEEGPGLYDRGKALGVTDAHMQRMLDLIKKRNDADQQAILKREYAGELKRQNWEFKVRRTQLMDEVRDDLSQRPDLAMDKLLAKGNVKLHPDFLTDDQKLRLPKDYLQKKNGVPPDEMASSLGFDSGDALVERLGMLTEERRRSGMSQRDYFNRLVDIETDRRLNTEFGDRPSAAMEWAKDRTLSKEGLDLVHEETLAYAWKAGQEPKFTAAEVLAQRREAAAETPVAQLDSGRLLQNALKIGKKIEEAGAKGKWAEAYRLSQQRQHSVIDAKIAREYESLKANLDRTAKTMSKRIPDNIQGEYMPWIHDALQRAGYKIKSLPSDLAERLGRNQAASLEDFKNQKEAEWGRTRELPVAGWMLDEPKWQKPVEEMTWRDFQGYKGTIDALVKAGRDESKVLRGDRAYAKRQLLDDMGKKLATFEPVDNQPRPGMLAMRMAAYGVTAKETTFNRWDRNDPLGVFNRHLSYPLADAANFKSVLLRDTERDLQKIDQPKTKDLKKLVDAPFEDPLNRTDANPDPGLGWKNFNQGNVLQMLRNAGNASNWKVLARGFAKDPAQLFKWLGQHVTLEDVKRIEAENEAGFGKLIKMADNMYEDMTGAPVEKIPLKPITFTFKDGTQYTSKGWYYPLRRDPIRQRAWSQDAAGQWHNTKVSPESVMDDPNYNVAPSNGYTVRRTGAIYPVDLDYNSTPTTMRQMIHDIAYRQTIHEVQKIFGDRGFQEDVSRYYGKEYSNGLMPYLRKLNGAEGIPSANLAYANKVVGALTQNIVGTYIGFNLQTVAKHMPTAWVMSMRGIGSKDFMRARFGGIDPEKYADATMALYGRALNESKGDMDFIEKNSEEIQRRDRNWMESLGAQQEMTSGSMTNIERLRKWMAQKGSSWVAASDMLSARPTWLGEYDKMRQQGIGHDLARQIADRAVRRAHGSTAETNRPPAVMGSGPLGAPLTAVYGFMGTIMQRRLEIAMDMNDSLKLGMDGDLKSALAKGPKILGDTMAYVAWPTLVLAATGAFAFADKRNWASYLTAEMTMGLGESVVFMRDFIHGLASGEDPGMGMLSSLGHDITNLLRDVKQGPNALSKQRIGKSIQDLTTVIGDRYGIAPKPIGKALRFGTDVATGQQKPKGIVQVIRGGLTGKAERTHR